MHMNDDCSADDASIISHYFLEGEECGKLANTGDGLLGYRDDEVRVSCV